MLKSRKKATNSSPNNTTDLDRYLNIDLISFEDDEDFDIFNMVEITTTQISCAFYHCL